MGYRFDDYCLTNGVHWAMRDDPWVLAIFNCTVPSADEQIERIRDIQNSEDFYKMNEERMQAYESMLSIPIRVSNRRDVIQGFWAGWGQPSPDSVKYICATICGIDTDDIQVNFTTEFMVDVYIDTEAELDGSYLYLCRLAIRQHIPAHYAMDVRANFTFYTIDDMEAKELSELNGKEGSVKLWNFES